MRGEQIVLAPDSFKGSLSSPQVCRIAAGAWKKVLPGDEVLAFPLADGGEGTVEALVEATGGCFKTAEVRGPLGEKVEAVWGVLGDGKTAVIEMAAASGLYLLPPEKRDPLHTSTYGTGQLIREALEEGCRRVLIGIGGSATNDGGAGMAQALGIKLQDAEGNLLPEGGRHLSRLQTIDASGLFPAAAEAEFMVACDVDNPLCGPYGASAVYGPQKGASPEGVQELEEALQHFARVVKRELGTDVAEMPGAGAAGGLGAGLVAFLGAELRRGTPLVIGYSGLEEVLAAKGTALVITGEGEINAQSARGKVPCGVAALARKYGVPVVALVGSVGEGVEAVYECGIEAVVDVIPRPMALDEAMGCSEELLARSAETLARLSRLFRKAGQSVGSYRGL